VVTLILAVLGNRLFDFDALERVRKIAFPHEGFGKFGGLGQVFVALELDAWMIISSEDNDTAVLALDFSVRQLLVLIVECEMEPTRALGVVNEELLIGHGNLSSWTF